VHDVSALGGEALAGREGQARIVARDDAVFEHALDALDQVVAHESVDHVVQGLRHQATRQVGVGLHLYIEQRYLADAEPPQWVVDADAPLVGQVEGIGHVRQGAPVLGQRRIFQSAHQS
jgi:hypothetical protein